MNWHIFNVIWDMMLLLMCVDNGWINQPGSVLNTYLDSLTDMLRYYRHTARINPFPENPLNIPTIDILATNKQLDDSTASRYVYARQQTESGYIKSFEIYITITTSYTELGSPPRTQTIEGGSPNVPSCPTERPLRSTQNGKDDPRQPPMCYARQKHPSRG